MKRILCIIESLGSGGAERQMTGLAVMLKQQGFEVEVCYYVQKEFYLSYLQDGGVSVSYLSDALSLPKRFLLIKKRINEYKPDTVISYSPSTNMIACVLKLTGAKFNLIVSERNTTQKLTLNERLKLFVYRWANYIVTNSFAQGAYIKERRSHLTRKIKVITNYVDTNKFLPSNREVEVNEVVRIICVGRMMPQKNILNFIRVVAVILSFGYKIKVDWFGQDLNDSYSAECHSAIRNHNLDGIFTFHKPSLDIENEYSNADVFCLPSLYEGYPNVLCEAMSCGMPVLSSRVSDTPSIVQDGVNGFLFDPLDIDDMVRIIRGYIDLPKTKKVEMGKKSREISVGLFAIDKFLSRYLEII